MSGLHDAGEIFFHRGENEKNVLAALVRNYKDHSPVTRLLISPISQPLLDPFPSPKMTVNPPYDELGFAPPVDGSTTASAEPADAPSNVPVSNPSGAPRGFGSLPTEMKCNVFAFVSVAVRLTAL